MMCIRLGCAQPQHTNFGFWSQPLPSYGIGRSLKKDGHHSSLCQFNVWLKHKINNTLQHGSFIHPSSALAEVHHIILIIWKFMLDNSVFLNPFLKIITGFKPYLMQSLLALQKRGRLPLFHLSKQEETLVVVTLLVMSSSALLQLYSLKLTICNAPIVK